MKKIIAVVHRHERLFFIIVGVIVVVGALGIYYLLRQTGSPASYTTTAVERGMISSSLSGTGQVSALHQIDVKPQAAGEIVKVNVASGAVVKEGDVLVQIDNRDAAKAARDAATALETAKLELATLLDPPDALQKTQAENTVADAKQKLADLLAPVDPATLRQAENTLTDAQDSLTKLRFQQETSYTQAQLDKQKAIDNLAKSYEDAFNSIAATFLELPTVMSGLDNVLHSYDIAASDPVYLGLKNGQALTTAANDDYDFRVYLEKAEAAYAVARAKYDTNFAGYVATSRYAEDAVIVKLLTDTIETVKAVSESIKSQINTLDYWVDYRTQANLRVLSKVTAYQSSLKSYSTTVNSDLSSLLSIDNSVRNYQEAQASAERSLVEMKQNQPLELAAAERNVVTKQDALADLKNGPDQSEIAAARRSLAEKELSLKNLLAGADNLTVRAKNIELRQKQDALGQAQETLANYYVKAPFGGTIASLPVAKGETVSSGTVVATLITEQMIAELTLNEIEAAQVKIGEPAILNFDAIDGLSISGQVIEVDTVGTVSQGVVSYGVRIGFDVQDERVKPGMSITATIIIDSRQNVLLVPTAAIKTQGGASYVEVLANNLPERRTVTTGLTDDVMVEIVDGLTEGDQVVTQTLSADSSASGNTPSAAGASTGNRNFGAPGGDMMRIIR